MDNRYSHPQVSLLWSRPWTLGAWTEIELATVRSQIDRDLIDRESTVGLIGTVEPEWNKDAIEAVDLIEKRTKHDVVAFVEYLRGWYGKPGRWLHYGLTSSDLVDTAQALRFHNLRPTLDSALEGLVKVLEVWEADRTMVLGRTHGQPAEPISMGMRASHWSATLKPARMQLKRTTVFMRTMKLSGPVGNFAHNPWSVEMDVADHLGLRAAGQGSSQVVPRGTLAMWASAASHVVNACAKIANDVRLMLMLDEAAEFRPDGQVGSSSMAHKKNPIRAEQICGMARLAAGYASMLQPLDLWLERDISSSSVERVAVPDLWHVLLHTLHQTTTLLVSLRVGYRGEIAIGRAGNLPYVHKETLQAIQDGQGAADARVIGMSANKPTDPNAPRYFERNWEYPA